MDCGGGHDGACAFHDYDVSCDGDVRAIPHDVHDDDYVMNRVLS